MEIVKNKKAYFDYEILESLEAGIQLLGHEVKSIRAWQVNLKWSYVSFIWQELFIKQMHISPWKVLANKDTMDTGRPRKVMMPKKKMIYYGSKLKEWGYTILALRIYLKWSLIKAEIGLAKWKKMHQKRQSLKERDIDRQAKIMLQRNY